MRSKTAPVVRGLLFALGALAAVSLFVRIQFPPAAASPAWTPKEAESVKAVVPATPVEKAAPAPAPERAPEPSVHKPSVARRAPQQHQQQQRIIVVVPQSTLAARAPAKENDTADPAPVERRVETAPTPKVADADPPQELDAPPPPPGVAASGRKPEDAPMPKRLFRAVGKFFKGKKATDESKVQPSDHNPK